MTFKKIRRAAVACILAGAACTAAALSGCNIKTSHPEAEIEIAFNGTTYVLEYKLYRNMYPQTVQHFIELADNDFYNDTVIHNYTTSNYWYGGGYSYNGAVGGEVTDYKAAFTERALDEYLEANSKEKAYDDLFKSGALTPSVYKEEDSDYQNPLPTLIGEFSTNDHPIESGALKASYGCLRMYYTAKDTDAIVLKKKDNNEGKVLLGQYKYNCATSLFNIQIGDSTAADTSYCIFATLKNPDKLNELKTAIADYISASEYSTSTFTRSGTVYVDNFDAFIAQRVNEQTYSLPAEPLVVKSINVTKY